MPNRDHARRLMLILLASDADKQSFRLAQDASVLPVAYVGSDTLPDTFVGGAQAIIEGDYSPDGTFRADKIQAKCASKYQAAPPGAPGKKVAAEQGPGSGG